MKRALLVIVAAMMLLVSGNGCARVGCKSCGVGGEGRGGKVGCGAFQSIRNFHTVNSFQNIRSDLRPRRYGGWQCDTCGGAPQQAQAQGSRPTYAQGPPTATYAYPYYTTRGPRDFLVDNPPTIGR